MPALTCPVCGAQDLLGDALRCGACGTWLEYGEDRKLHPSPEALTCPCGTRNPLTSPVCEACGQALQQRCTRCGMLHPLGRRVCSRYGQVMAASWGARQAVSAAVLLVALGLAVVLWPSRPVDEPQPFPTPVALVGPRLDVVFVIDATGSMADEIDVVKEHIQAMMARIRAGRPAPRVRFGLVAYRDHGDEFLNRVFDLAEDPGFVELAMRQLQADGGGDTPEAVAEALHAAVHEIHWDDRQGTSRMLFLVGDAAPHQDFGADVLAEVRAARARGITVHSLGCSGIQISGELEFRQVADLGGGRFEFLTYRQQVVRADGGSGHVLYQGGATYEATEEARDWKRGASHMLREGKARALPAAAPLPAAPSAGLENNLDSVLTESVMDEARKSGVSY